MSDAPERKAALVVPADQRLAMLAIQSVLQDPTVVYAGIGLSTVESRDLLRQALERAEAQATRVDQVMDTNDGEYVCPYCSNDVKPNELQNYRDYVNGIAREALTEYPDDEDRRNEFIHESVDGSHYVVYTSEHLKVIELSGSDLDTGDLRSYVDFSDPDTDLDKIHQTAAFLLLRADVEQQVQDYTDALEEQFEALGYAEKAQDVDNEADDEWDWTTRDQIADWLNEQDAGAVMEFNMNGLFATIDVESVIGAEQKPVVVYRVAWRDADGGGMTPEEEVRQSAEGTLKTIFEKAVELV